MQAKYIAFMCVVVLLPVEPALAREIAVAKTGSDQNAGTSQRPFLTIQHAANVARAGDTVVVHAGIYREQVDPPTGGTSNHRRITFEAAPGEDVRIVGSERVSEWTKVGGLWTASLPASFFPHYNPFATSIRSPKNVDADTKHNGTGWLLYGLWAHAGDIYIDGDGLVEQETRDGLTKPLSWIAEVNADGTTTLWANFADRDPNASSVEINARRSAFFPSRTNVNFITFRGFVVMNTAPLWAPPTVPQQGAIGPNGGHHWIIENNAVLYAKSVCVSVGIPSGTAGGRAAGHHIIRNNVIMRCGQAGIAGQEWNDHSTIANNDIEEINYRREFGGWETAAIKLHGTHDTKIHDNFIRNVSTPDTKIGAAHGIWLDFKNSNVSVRRNVIVGAEGSSILLEANWHGPFAIRDNVIVGGKLATYSSRDAHWSHNLFVEATGEWINQADQHRPNIGGAVWSNNLFVGGGLFDSKDQSRCNLYLKGASQAPSGQFDVSSGDSPEFSVNYSPDYVSVEYALSESVLKRSTALVLGASQHCASAGRAGRAFYGPFPLESTSRQRHQVFRFSAMRKRALAVVHVADGDVGGGRAP